MSYSAISRDSVHHEVAIYITARNRTTGLAEEMGLWTGREDISVTIGGDVRTYTGAGPVVMFPPIRTRVGLTVQMQTVKLAALSDEVENAIRLYDSRLAPVEIHVIRFNADTGDFIGVDRVFRGSIDKAPIITPQKNGEGGGASISIVPSSRSLTRGLTVKRSDESQKLRSNDRFFRYADVAGKVERFWGTARVSATGVGSSESGGFLND